MHLGASIYDTDEYMLITIYLAALKEDEQRYSAIPKKDPPYLELESQYLAG